ncbi:MAG: PBP1A family penicillin-binding protein [Rhodospirillales bacterium]|nr:PBP1A family penicillin-binding protein [Rhodospirillales bacterium]
MARTGKRRQEARGRSRRRAAALFLARWGLVLLIWTGFIGAGVVLWYARDLPDTSRLNEITRRPAVTLVAADGEIVATYGDLYGTIVSLQDLPPYLPGAVLAIEDRRFHAHFGIDPLGVARAIWVNLRTGKFVQGGSTITQQLAKNLFLTPERTLKRKIQEVLLALWLERTYNKDQILALYLNRVYLGAGAYGVDAAARKYFGKPAREVTLFEAAMLAGLLKAPSRFNPTSDPEAARSRAAIVLNSMVEAGYLQTDQVIAALSSDADVGRTAAADWTGRYFADWVYDQVSSYVGITERDLVVVTTIDLRLQRLAEAELKRIIAEEGPQRGAAQAALVMMTPDGAVKAMVGGRDYRESEFNRAAQAMRQPGSAFKLFVFLAALEAGTDPDDLMVDGPIQVKNWRPENYQERYYGEVTIREAFARSLNSVAVQLYLRAGSEAVIRAAGRLGITAELNPEPALALGSSEVSLIELTSAYAVFANQGHGVWYHGIEEIQDSAGTVLFRRAGDGPGRVVEPRQVEDMNNLMTAVIEWGTGSSAALDRPAAGKTGTSQEFRDAWFVGFTAELVTGVWVGNDDGKPMDKVTGGGLPATIWRSVMTKALEGVPPRPLPGGGEPAVAGIIEEGAGFINNLLERLRGATESGEAAVSGNAEKQGKKSRDK